MGRGTAKGKGWRNRTGRAEKAGDGKRNSEEAGTEKSNSLSRKGTAGEGKGESNWRSRKAISEVGEGVESNWLSRKGRRGEEGSEECGNGWNRTG